MTTAAVPYSHPAWIEIDKQQLCRNLQIIRQHIGDHPKLLFPVKANAYGHGLIPTAQLAADYVDYFGVACLQEGILLRDAGIKKPILVLGAIHVDQIPELIKYDLEITISSLYKAEKVAEACKSLKKSVSIHLEIDTGMQRTGVRVPTAAAVLKYIRAQSCLKLAGVYSHLATADEPNHPFSQVQTQEFINFVQQQDLLQDPNVICHLANSAATACYAHTHLDMVRPGLISYGYYPRPDIPHSLQDIQPCFAVKARVAYFKTILAGQGVSYNHSFTAKKQSRLLTIPLGYGDGYRRALSNKAQILLNDTRYPVVGNICMDQFMVDIGDSSAYVGDVVTIIGKDGQQQISLEEISQVCATIPYEILCGFNDRLPRIYV